MEVIGTPPPPSPETYRIDCKMTASIDMGAGGASARITSRVHRLHVIRRGLIESDKVGVFLIVIGNRRDVVSPWVLNDQAHASARFYLFSKPSIGERMSRQHVLVTVEKALDIENAPPVFEGPIVHIFLFVVVLNREPQEALGSQQRAVFE